MNSVLLLESVVSGKGCIFSAEAPLTFYSMTADNLDKVFVSTNEGKYNLYKGNYIKVKGASEKNA